MQDWKVKLKSVRGFTTTFTTFYDRDIKTYAKICKIQMLLFFWNRAQEGGRKSFRYEELNPDYIIPKKHGILVPYLDILQKDLDDRA